jgi:hypothetical protein
VVWIVLEVLFLLFWLVRVCVCLCVRVRHTLSEAHILFPTHTYTHAQLSHLQYYLVFFVFSGLGYFIMGVMLMCTYKLGMCMCVCVCVVYATPGYTTHITIFYYYFTCHTPHLHTRRNLLPAASSPATHTGGSEQRARQVSASVCVRECVPICQCLCLFTHLHHTQITTRAHTHRAVTSEAHIDVRRNRKSRYVCVYERFIDVSSSSAHIHTHTLTHMHTHMHTNTHTAW